MITLFDVLLVAVPAIPANLIVWLYWRARWWTTPLGKGMALTAASVAAMLNVVVAIRIYPAALESLRPALNLLYVTLTIGLFMKYRAFRSLERERREQIARIVKAMPPTHKETP